ncbi:unnamed protein product, partial [Rotaria sp. Silwood1]
IIIIVLLKEKLVFSWIIQHLQQVRQQNHLNQQLESTNTAQLQQQQQQQQQSSMASQQQQQQQQ